MNESKKVFKGLKSQTIVMLSMSILQLVNFSFMSRLLTAEDFGYFAVLTAVTAIFGSITEAGLGASVIQKKDPSRDFISTAFCLSIIMGVFSMLLLIGTSSVLSDFMLGSKKLIFAFVLMSLNLLLTNVTSVIGALYKRKLDFLKYGSFEIASYVLSSCLGIYLAFIGYGFYAIVLSILVNHILTTTLLYVLNRKSFDFKIEKACVKDILNYGGWLTAGVIVRTIAEQLDKMFLSRWLSVTKLGMYNRPAGIVSQFSGKAFGIFDVILFPILSGIQDDYAKTRSAYIKAFQLITTLSCIACAGLILCSELIIDIFLGSKWIELNTLLQLIILNLVFCAISRIQDCFYRSLGYLQYYFVSRCVLCVSTLIGLYIGCQYGLEAVAISMIVIRLIEVLFKGIYLNKRINVNNVQFIIDLFRCSLYSIVIFVFCYLFKEYIIGGPFLSTALFVGMLLVAALAKPQIMGAHFYSYVYMKFLNPIIVKIKH